MKEFEAYSEINNLIFNSKVSSRSAIFLFF